MKIERIELRRIYLPYVSRFETSGWYHDGSFAIIVRVDADGVTGWGESPVSDGPWYNEETYETAWIMQKNFLGPMLLAADLEGPEQVRDVADRLAREQRERLGCDGEQLGAVEARAAHEVAREATPGRLVVVVRELEEGLVRELRHPGLVGEGFAR